MHQIRYSSPYYKYEKGLLLRQKSHVNNFTEMMIHDDKMENCGEGRHKIIYNMRKVMYYECMDLAVILYMQKLLHEF